MYGPINRSASHVLGIKKSSPRYIRKNRLSQSKLKRLSISGTIWVRNIHKSRRRLLNDIVLVIKRHAKKDRSPTKKSIGRTQRHQVISVLRLFSRKRSTVSLQSSFSTA